MHIDTIRTLNDGGRAAWVQWIRDTLALSGCPEDTFCATYGQTMRPWNAPAPYRLDDYTDTELKKLATFVEKANRLWTERLQKAG